jgi:CBS domain-containing protein
MTPEPVVLPDKAVIADAAHVMRDRGLGSVLVGANGRVIGVVTDRDITIRATADRRGPNTSLAEVCSQGELSMVALDAPLETAAEIMRTAGVRRLPVVGDGMLVGVISVGDLACANPVLSGIAVAPPTAGSGPGTETGTGTGTGNSAGPDAGTGADEVIG